MSATPTNVNAIVPPLPATPEAANDGGGSGERNVC